MYLMQNLISAGDLLKRSWDQYTKHFKSFREPLIWTMIPSVLIALLPIIPGATSGTELLLSIITSIIMLWASVRIIDASWSLYEGKAPAASLTRTLAWGPVGRTVDYAIISILAGVLVILGVFLLIVPGIIFANWFAFAPLVTLIEGLHGTGALKRSKELVAGRFWPIAWRWIVLNVIPTLALVIIVSVLGGAIAAATGTLETYFTMDATTWWSNLISAVTSVLAMPYFLIASVILFAEAKKTR